jgi:Protein of unknown function (DUF3738)
MERQCQCTNVRLCNIPGQPRFGENQRCRTVLQKRIDWQQGFATLQMQSVGFWKQSLLLPSYAPDRGGAGREGPNVSPAADSFPESVFTALREQLGLNLEAQKSQVEFIVVDRLDRLIPN